MRSRFDDELNALNKELIIMGANCERAIALAAKALLNSDAALAAEVAEAEREIDRLEREIETLCLRLLLQQQPVARDLRQISAALKMITDMERIGDQALDIAEIIKHLDRNPEADCGFIKEMATAVIKMVTESIDAYVKRDIAIAESVIGQDDHVDSLFMDVKDSLIAMLVEDYSDGEYALDLLMIAKYFERIGDHAVNIAEWVIFSVTGEHEKGVSQ
ncbi:MAG: phosphate signaling complex protein PhoU [Oscillospiraceae bacterium]|nr:phosphate signaling complex protein PhoU [Oscillospiraceae bacterium]